jgi:hypothetical protein
MGKGHKLARVHVKSSQGASVHLQFVEEEDIGIGL